MLDMYKTGQLNDKRSLKNAIVALSNPTMFGKKKVEEYYMKATGQFTKKKGLPQKLKVEYTLKVLLFTDIDKKNPDMEGTNELDEETRKKKTVIDEEVSKASQVLGWNIKCAAG